MRDSKFKVGDIVRYKGDDTPDWNSLEGEITYLGTAYAKILVGDERTIYPDLDNLELVQLAKDVVVTAEAVAHPAHYGGDTTYEVIKVAEAWELDKDAYLFNVIKYVARAGKKAKSTLLEDLKKARFYLDRRIKSLEEELSPISK